MNMNISRVERTPFELPYRDVPEQYMSWMRPHWRYFELVEVELASGHIGYGETMLNYTWGASTDDDALRAKGRNAAELLWDDSLGSGIQMALFDAVAKALEVPIHCLLGEKVRDQTPLSWWATDMQGDDWVAECQQAIEKGYRNIKVKARPWWDIREAVATMSEAVPDWLEIDLDFNGTLLDADQAIPLLEELTQYPQIRLIETPIPQDDIEGNKTIRESLDVELAMHYGSPPVFDQTPPPLIALTENVCDGFVLTGGCSQMIQEGAVAAMADKPLWLQLVGTGITAAFTLHLGAVIDQATWPAVTCRELHADSVLTDPIDVSDGYAAVPDGPGLGVDLDMDVIKKHHIERSEVRPDPPRLIKSVIPGDKAYYFSNYEPQMKEYAQCGEFPYFPQEVYTEFVPNNGSDNWNLLHNQAKEQPVLRDVT